MAKADLVPADLPTLPTAQLLARLSAEPGRCEMTVDAASPWVAGVIVRTPRLLLALHAVNAAEAQIIASPRVPGLSGSGDAQLQALLANAAPQDQEAYRPVPPPDPDEAAPPPLENALAQEPSRAARADVPLVVVWVLFAALAFLGGGGLLTGLAALFLVGAAVLELLGVPARKAQPGTSTALRTLSLVTGIISLLALVLTSTPVMVPVILLLALMSGASGTAARLTGFPQRQPPVVSTSSPDSQASTPLALPEPQVQLIEITRSRLAEHLAEAERGGHPRDVFEARQALEIHLPEVVQRWEALPSWRRRDEAPLRRTLEKLTSASLPDTTTSELEWDATERFIEQKARARSTEPGELSVRREPLTPPARIQDTAQNGPTEEKS